MKKSLIAILIAGAALIIITFILLIKPQNLILSDETKKNIFDTQKQSLGDLCSGKDECINFCLNNKGQCEQYCKGSDNELCITIFPPDELINKDNKKENNQITDREDCEGTQTKFDFAPVNLDKTKYMLPRGLMVGDHVTPVNHHYFQNFDNTEYNIEVYSPGKGYITDIGHMPGAEEGKDYNINIRHTCTISTNYIYISDLPEKIKAYAPPLHGYRGVKIPVEAGELIGYYKNNLDYNLFDKDTKLSGFVVPEHYAVEPDKIHIVENTYEYFNEPVKSKLIDKSIRTAEPISGKIDYDIDGKLVGNWFLEGTNGYGGNVTKTGDVGYASGHLSFVYDYIDPERIAISIAGYEGEESKQFGVKENSPDPADIGIENGLIKYELITYDYIKPDGSPWDRISLAKNIKTRSNEMVHGVLLVQMIDSRKIKFETFPRKTASQINEFTQNAKIYER